MYCIRSHFGANTADPWGHTRALLDHVVFSPAVAMMVALEDGVIDTATVVDTKQGRLRLLGRDINDSRKGGYGEISAARALEVSSKASIDQKVGLRKASRHARARGPP